MIAIPRPHPLGPADGSTHLPQKHTKPTMHSPPPAPPQKKSKLNYPAAKTHSFFRIPYLAGRQAAMSEINKALYVPVFSSLGHLIKDWALPTPHPSGGRPSGSHDLNHTLLSELVCPQLWFTEWLSQLL